jgi:hypothetical protein
MAIAPSSGATGWTTSRVIVVTASFTCVSLNCTAPHVWNGAVKSEIAGTTSHPAHSFTTTLLTISTSIDKHRITDPIHKTLTRTKATEPVNEPDACCASRERA